MYSYEVRRNIRKQLELKGYLHEKDLAEGIAMCPTILSKKLNGRGNKIFTVYDILDILKFLNCKFEDIFGVDYENR